MPRPAPGSPVLTLGPGHSRPQGSFKPHVTVPRLPCPKAKHHTVATGPVRSLDLITHSPLPLKATPLPIHLPSNTRQLAARVFKILPQMMPYGDSPPSPTHLQFVPPSPHRPLPYRSGSCLAYTVTCVCVCVFF
jgi:hypothetical protein